MIFKITGKRIQPHDSSWNPTELEVERYLYDPDDPSNNALRQEIFGEELLVIRSQRLTRQKKRADLIAVDKAGNGTVIEIKRHKGRLGVDTQALQYLAEFSAHKGLAFLEHVTGDTQKYKEVVSAFLEGEVDIEDLNEATRVILLARSFDEALFAMGEWLASLGIAFRCITYTPFNVKRDKFLSFSVAFDRSPRPLYRLVFPKTRRERRFFWHNIGDEHESWWQYLKRKGEITASWQNEPGDKGEGLLRSYVTGDTIFAYASGFGAIGWGEAKDQNSYRLVEKGSTDDKLKGWHLHRLGITWKSVAPQLKRGIPPSDVEKKYGIYHPVGTRALIDPQKAKKLQEALTAKFGTH